MTTTKGISWSPDLPFLAFLFLSLLLPWRAYAGLFAEETPSLDPDAQRIFDRALQDSQKGDAKAMGTLGLLYEKGRGCPRDLEKALKWLRKGAGKGDPAAQNNLGFLYFQGIGVKEDDREALRWFQKAADQGLASAQTNLGLIHARGGPDIPKDHPMAFSWFQKAADQGDLDAQIDLAQMYSLGDGTGRDLVASYQWFTLALDHPGLEGDPLAQVRNDIEWLEKHMTGPQVKEGKKKAADWKKAHSRAAEDPEH